MYRISFIRTVFNVVLLIFLILIIEILTSWGNCSGDNYIGADYFFSLTSFSSCPSSFLPFCLLSPLPFSPLPLVLKKKEPVVMFWWRCLDCRESPPNNLVQNFGISSADWVQIRSESSGSQLTIKCAIVLVMPR